MCTEKSAARTEPAQKQSINGVNSAYIRGGEAWKNEQSYTQKPLSSKE